MRPNPIALAAASIVVLAACGLQGGNASDSGPTTVPGTGTTIVTVPSAVTTATSPATRQSEEMVSPQSDIPVASVPPNQPPEGDPAGPVFEGPIDQGLKPFIDLAVADLASRIGVPTAEIEVLSAVLVVWPDTSLGCPVAGMEYPQVPQDGSLIELSHNGSVYRYHSGGTRGPFLCIRAPKSPPATGDTLIPPPGSDG